jgi:NTE family protein
MKVGIVLSGGGARGLAHIGAMRAMEERGLEPVAIAACSMGGIVGALWGAGYRADEIEELFSDMSAGDLLAFGTMGGLIGGKRIERKLTKVLPERFENLQFPLAVTAVDVQNGHLLILRSGALAPALRASSALPGILSPVKHEGRILIDGGLLNNLPVDVIRTMTLAPVLAVDVAAPPDRHLDFEAGESFWKQIESLFTSRQRVLTIELFMKAIDIPQALITEMRLAMQPPELLVRPPLAQDLKVENFDRVEEAIRVGYAATKRALEERIVALHGG